MDTDEDTVLTGTGNNGKLYSISRSDKTGWTVVDCTNVRELLSKSRQAQSIYVLTAVVLVIVALLFPDLWQEVLHFQFRNCVIP